MDGSYKVFDGIGKFWQRNTQELENSKTVTGLVNRVRKVSDAAQPMIKEGLSELKEMTTKPSSIHSDSTTSSLPSFMEGRNNHRNVKTNSKVIYIKKKNLFFLLLIFILLFLLDTRH